MTIIILKWWFFLFLEIRDLYNQRHMLHDEFRQQQLRYMEAMKSTTSDNNTSSNTNNDGSDKLSSDRSREQLPRNNKRRL